MFRKRTSVLVEPKHGGYVVEMLIKAVTLTRLEQIKFWMETRHLRSPLLT